MTDLELKKKINKILNQKLIGNRKKCPFCDFRPPVYYVNQKGSIATHIRWEHKKHWRSRSEQLYALFKDELEGRRQVKVKIMGD